jgi:hypothetical protein
MKHARAKDRPAKGRTREEARFTAIPSDTELPAIVQEALAQIFGFVGNAQLMSAELIVQRVAAQFNQSSWTSFRKGQRGRKGLKACVPFVVGVSLLPEPA